MHYRAFSVTSFAQNCSLVWCNRTKAAALIDLGGEAERMLREIDERGLHLEKLLVTHGHIDHVGAVAETAQRFKLPIEGPQIDDRFWLEALDQQSQMFGFPRTDRFEPTRWLCDGDTVEIGDERLEVLHCPGHTPGHIAFFHRADRVAFVGDVLFRGSIGRTDFPGGDHAMLLRSIRDKLWPLGDDVDVVTGHGPNTTIGIERKTNPFLCE